MKAGKSKEFEQWLNTRRAVSQAAQEQTSDQALEEVVAELLEKTRANFQLYRRDPTPNNFKRWEETDEACRAAAVGLRRRRARYCHPDDTVD